jgi:hypothetical protein
MYYQISSVLSLSHSLTLTLCPYYSHSCVCVCVSVSVVCVCVNIITRYRESIYRVVFLVGKRKTGRRRSLLIKIVLVF